MQNSFFGIILLIIMNTVPNKVEKFNMSLPNENDVKLEFAWNEDKERWDVEDNRENKHDNWLIKKDSYMLLGSDEQIDTLNFSEALPGYENIKWKKTKSIDIEGGNILIEKKRKHAIITLASEFFDESLEINIDWKK